MLQTQTKENQIFSPIRNKWLIKTPEEIVRQNFLCVLVNDYGYNLDQIQEEVNLTGRGSAQAKADFAIFRGIEDKNLGKNPFIIVECKAESITISEKDYLQGELYARICNCQFFVTHNTKETKFWRVKQDKTPGYREEIENIPHNNATEKEIAELYSKLKVFKEKEFNNVLDTCHNILRSNDKLDPAAAFDEIAKILFMKVYAERNLRKGKENVFSLEWVENAEQYNPDYLNFIFEKAKTDFGKNAIFKPDEKINLKSTTIKQIIQKFEKYNLSETSVDVKGIALENFLQNTFRGELGQFFTPRPVVDFMVDFLDPQENDLVCDPTCGSGGFLIKYFQKVQNRILENLNQEYQENKEKVENSDLAETEKNQQVLELFGNLEKDSDINNPISRLYKLSNKCVFGTDANDRMARIAKMNMIMHGDGHGGIYHHDGFVDVGEIGENKFDLILANPPFGMRENNKEILKNFEISRNKDSITTQILFLERCINLLKEGGKLGIVLPNNIFNGGENKEFRCFCEDKGYILATISLPRETFISSKADVNCSLLFFKKFTEQEKQIWQNLLITKKSEVLESRKAEREKLEKIINQKLNKKNLSEDEYENLKNQKSEAKKRLKELDDEVETKGRKLAKESFDYEIFMFEADSSGISTTGILTKENDLTKALEDYKNFLIQTNFKYSKSVKVKFSNLKRWDAKNYLYQLKSKFPLENLGDYIYEHSEKVKLFEYKNEQFPILGVTNKNGVYLNEYVSGDEINQPYKLVNSGEITYNPYRVNVGSIGLIPEEFNGFYISPAYIILGVKEEKKNEILEEYIYFVLSSDWYNPFLRASTSGSVRQNLTFDLLSELQIPVPSIEIQKQKIKEWKSLKQKELEVKTQLDNFILNSDQSKT